MPVVSSPSTVLVVSSLLDATVRAGKALGYRIILPPDATTAVPVRASDGKTWDAADVQNLTLAILGNEYAEVVTSEELIARTGEERDA